MTFYQYSCILNSLKLAVRVTSAGAEKTNRADGQPLSAAQKAQAAADRDEAIEGLTAWKTYQPS